MKRKIKKYIFFIIKRFQFQSPFTFINQMYDCEALNVKKNDEARKLISQMFLWTSYTINIVWLMTANFYKVCFVFSFIRWPYQVMNELNVNLSELLSSFVNNKFINDLKRNILNGREKYRIPCEFSHVLWRKDDIYWRKNLKEQI